jgi:hypothetical protein
MEITDDIAWSLSRAGGCQSSLQLLQRAVRKIAVVPARPRNVSEIETGQRHARVGQLALEEVKG